MSYYILLLNELPVVDDIIKLIKEYYFLYTFPRIGCKCKYHNIPYNLVPYKGRLYPKRKEMTIAKNYLGDDLFIGDIVEFEAMSEKSYAGYCIYDGRELEYVSKHEFPIISEFLNVKAAYIPINYWHLDYIYFDLTPYLEECLNNISFDKEDKCVYTTFNYNYVKHYVVADFYVDDVDDTILIDKVINQFREALPCVDKFDIEGNEIQSTGDLFVPTYWFYDVIEENSDDL